MVAVLEVTFWGNVQELVSSSILAFSIVIVDNVSCSSCCSMIQFCCRNTNMLSKVAILLL